MLSLCKNCHCMTKTINNKCGKCKTMKLPKHIEEEFDEKFLEIIFPGHFAELKDFLTKHLKEEYERGRREERENIFEVIRLNRKTVGVYEDNQCSFDRILLDHFNMGNNKCCDSIINDSSNNTTKD